MDTFLEDFGNSISSLLNRTVNSNIPDQQILYHYTNCDSLLSILQDKIFWISNIELMNDKNEIDYSLDIVKKSFDKLKMSSDIKKEIVKKYEDWKLYSSINTYVLSFSLHEDSLILWNNYAKNDGYNLGIKRNAILKSIKEKKFDIINENSSIIVNGKVLYNENEQIELISTLLNKYHEIISHFSNHKYSSEEEKQISNQLNWIWIFIILYSCLIKSFEHEHENEYRIIVGIPDNSNAVFFRNRNGLILPYVKTKVIEHGFFSEVTIGPKIDDNIAYKTLKYFLDKKVDLNIPIKKSLIKLRF